MKISKSDFCGYIVITAIIFLFAGYLWRMYHDSQIKKAFNSDAENQVASIADSLADGRPFTLFGIYKIIPTKTKNIYIVKKEVVKN